MFTVTMDAGEALMVLAAIREACDGGGVSRMNEPRLAILAARITEVAARAAGQAVPDEG